ncbi:MAG: hypothetical protein IKQ31_00900 [Clostridia bacterium]|nr:hypothetical protein [Clostridia bacterium]
MNKRFLTRLIAVSLLLVVAVFYTLSIVPVQGFEWFSLGWAGTIVLGGWGILWILGGLFNKTVGTLKKTEIFVGAALLILAFGCLITEITIKDNLVLPIIFIIIAFAAVLSVIAVGGNRWDSGDNKQVGYKNYFQRKKAEEKAEVKQEKAEQKEESNIRTEY